MRMGRHGRVGNLSCERVVVAQDGDGEVVMRTAKYSVTGHPYHIGRQVLRYGGIVVQTVRSSDCQPYTLCLMIATWWALVQALVSRFIQCYCSSLGVFLSCLN
jgi:hypothetical protein